MNSLLKHSPRLPASRLRTLAGVVALLFASGCAISPVIPPKIEVPPRAATVDLVGAPVGIDAGAKRQTEVTANPTPQGPPQKQALIPPPPAAPSSGNADIIFNFSELPLSAFAQAVYATALKRSVSIDPAVMSRKDLVTLRSGKSLTASEADANARLVLKSYGVAVQDLGSLVRIVPDNTNVGYVPEIRRGRALPETPLPLRPVFQMVELNVVRSTDVTGYVRALMGEKIRMTEDSARNSLMLSGNGDDVQAALDIIQTLDQPLFKGRNSIRITPAIFSAEEMTKRLTEILTQEGYSVGTTSNAGAVQFPITLLPVAGINSIIVFAQSKEVIDHIVDWAKVLDKPAERSVGRNFFSYQVRNTDASRLRDTVQQLLSGVPARGGTAAAGGGAQPAPSASSSVVVDKASNTILFRASGEEYSDIIRLLMDLDRTTRQVMIDVTVVEVKIDDTFKTGVDWVNSRLTASGTLRSGFGGNTGGVLAPNAFPRSASGLVLSLVDGTTPRAVIEASATDDRGTVLSNPKLLARNGETATVQVGSSIPILTQQQTNSATGGGVISSVQYAETGTILRIKPVIHSSDQVDLDITQEVSVPGPVGAGPSSPPIDKKMVDTKLTLKHGSTYVLAGLISETKKNTTSGVPFLKDIPVLGRAFKSDSMSSSRTELVVMITPYIMNDDSDSKAISEAIRKQLGPWAQAQSQAQAAKAAADDKAK